MDLTQEEKQFVVEILTQVSLNFQASKLREAIIGKLSLPPVAVAKAQE